MNSKINFFIILFVFTTTLGFSQNFNIEQLPKAKLIKVSGGVSANSILYSGNSQRDPFTYFLNGNVNINVAGLYNLPFSFSYTNQKFGYNKPVLMNRLSIHPSYKWITAHIGDASMSFSPYTLSGHQFTGFGVDLTPQGKFKISAMYGRLIKSSEFDTNNVDLVPTYKRYGYGFKTSYALDKVNLGLTFFKAKDQEHSLTIPIPFELGVSPKENAAISLETTFKLFDMLQVVTEVANSSITEDSRMLTDGKRKGFSSYFLNPNTTTESYNAFKGQLVYPAGNGTLGLGYERVDPNYRTLGGYFFNNDLENITLNASQSLYKNKVSIALNLGMQKDNLEKQKVSQMKRLVTSITIDYKANEKLNINLNFSNFQSFTNSRNQFDYINQTSDFDYLDTLNFRQVNRNAGIAINYLLKNDKKLKKALNVNFSFQDAVNQQQGKTIQGGATSFYNSAVSYIVGYPEQALNFTGSLNNTYSKLENENNLIIGPTLGISKLFYDNKLNTSFSSSYNTSFANGDKKNDVFNFRLSSSYVYLEKHNFSLGVISLLSKSAAINNNDLTATFSYTYSFDKIKLRAKKEVKSDKELTLDTTVKINFKGKVYEGTKEEISKQLQELQLHLQAMPTAEITILEKLLTEVSLAQEDKEIKDKVLDYLEKEDANATIIKKQNQYLLEVIKKIEQDMLRKDESFEIDDIKATENFNNHTVENANSSEDTASHNMYLQLENERNVNHNRLINHRWMLNEFSILVKTPVKELQQNEYFTKFCKQELEETFNLIADDKDEIDIKNQMEQKIIPFYHELAKNNSGNDKME
ncbi:hypothetical protein [Flavobacterium sp. PL002]|uniref:hypothetical protein n=1 Tax=Flavobacterium sp. PL002 TaxID=1897058 RepID=UPI001787C072|nr:hypothetical protein [Flavobacterium sp. PL002]MBE0391549.1 hypothetical protein [Flavobacterium sp. PL002]